MKSLKRIDIKFRTNFLVLMAVSMLFASCEEKVEIDLPAGPERLVVDGWITDADSIQVITLAYTAAYFSNAPLPPATAAEVVVRDDSGMVYSFTESLPGRYEANMTAVSGRSYTLEIELADGTIYKSDPEKLLAVPPIDSIYYELEVTDPVPADSGRYYAVLINTREAVGYGDFYRWREILNGEEQTGPYDIYLANDEFVNGQLILELNVFDKRYRLGDTVCVVQERISDAASTYLTEVLQQTAYVGGPFDPPPAPIEGNISNISDPTEPALGFFAAAGHRTACVVVGQ